MRKNPEIKYRFVTKFLIGLLVFSLLPILTFSVFTSFFMTDLMRTYVEKQAEQSLNVVVHSLENTISDYSTALQTLQKDESFIRLLDMESPYSKEARDSYIYEKIYLIMARKAKEDSMYVVSADGSYQVSLQEMPSHYHPVTYKEWGVFRALQNNEKGGPIVFPQVYKKHGGKRNSITLATEIRNSTKVLGYVLIDISETALQSIFEMPGTEYNSRKYLVTTENGLVLYNNIMPERGHFFLSPKINQFLAQQQKEPYLSLNGSQYYSASQAAAVGGITVIGLYSTDFIMNLYSYVNTLTITVILGSVILVIIVGLFYGRSISKPIQKIVGTIEEIEKGNLGLRINLKNRDEMGYVATKFDEVLDSLNYYYQTDLELHDRIRLAELRALQAQMNPHFLYNTLDSIKWIAKLNAVPQISTIVTELGRQLKSSMNTDVTEVTLKESIDLIESYIGIQQIRYENRFTYEISVSQELQSYILPKLLIQPLVENVMVHGIEKSLHPIHFKVSAYTKEDYTYIEVDDNGPGMEYSLEDFDGEEIALKNIDKRIKLYYGEIYGLHIDSELGKGTRVILKLPLQP